MSIYTGRNEDSSGNILLSIGNGMTATLETGTTASQAYTKGAYVFFDNKLCKATTAIVSGDTLAIGTNLAQTSVGTELTSHLRSSDDKEFYFDVSDGKYGFYPSASKVASEFVPFGGTPSFPSSVYTHLCTSSSGMNDCGYNVHGVNSLRIVNGSTSVSIGVYDANKSILLGTCGVYPNQLTLDVSTHDFIWFYTQYSISSFYVYVES